MAKATKKSKDNDAVELVIDQQIWAAKNLNVKNFKNGDVILEAKSSEDWKNAGENKIPAWSYYENDAKNGEKYGVLYNWYAVSDPRGLAPEGWHIPSEFEWNELVKFLGPEDAGEKLKSKTGWEKDCRGNNEFAFSALPGGARFDSFIFIEDNCYFWTSTQGSSSTALCKVISCSDKIRGWIGNKNMGMYVRCLKGDKIIYK